MKLISTIAEETSNAIEPIKPIGLSFSDWLSVLTTLIVPAGIWILNKNRESLLSEVTQLIQQENNKIESHIKENKDTIDDIEVRLDGNKELIQDFTHGLESLEKELTSHKDFLVKVSNESKLSGEILNLKLQNIEEKFGKIENNIDMILKKLLEKNKELWVLNQ